MIINTGQRTDIPAFFSEWFFNRIHEGFVAVRNPYDPKLVLEYELNPRIVDCLCFCTKNPQPMLSRINELKDYRQVWFVTITAYGKEIEPYVPPYYEVVKSFQQLSQIVGKKAIAWRYDPIFLSDTYTIEKHLEIFEYIASQLSSYTQTCIISFIDLYQKTKKNFPDVKAVSHHDQHRLAKEMARIAKKYHILLKMCLEGEDFKQYGIDCSGCMTQAVIEDMIGVELIIPHHSFPRKGCRCLLNADIGVYNTCLHGCLYCYANYNRQVVVSQYRKHDPHSPFLIGNYCEDDCIKKVKQKSYINPQLSLF